MCSYNALNGVPMCANSKLLNDTLRGQWGFTGYVTSDCGAVGNIFQKEPQGLLYVLCILKNCTLPRVALYAA
eukprot:m.57244 g.57244  ORF g.57244 m.57244 type:complete len:72 (+) comp11091_c0_seq1:280-495(+)